MSDASRRRDLVHKARLHAAGAVPEYWVVDLESGETVVHTGPRPDGMYATVRRVAFGDELTALGVTIRIADLLA